MPLRPPGCVKWLSFSRPGSGDITCRAVPVSLFLTGIAHTAIHSRVSLRLPAELRLWQYAQILSWTFVHSKDNGEELW